MKIAGAKKVRLIGDAEPPKTEQPPLPAWLEDEPSFGKAADDGTTRGTYLTVKKTPAKTKQLSIKEIKPRTELEKDKRPERRGGIQHLSSTNIFGLTSRSESMYPEAYRPILTEHWRHASDDEYNAIIRRQAQINKVVSFRQNATEALDMGTTDQAYEEASGRRHQALRRRRKPRNYEERKKAEEERRKAPLYRRYMSRDSILEDSSFVSTGPLDTQVLVPGFATVIREVRRSRAVKPARRQRRMAKAPEPENTPKPVPKLPEFNAKDGPQVSLQNYRNAFGLKSRCVTAYPEAFREVSKVFWKRLTREECQDIAKVQAVAMEKVGFERRTEKQFIEDFDPVQENRYCMDSSNTQQKKERVHIPLKYYFAMLLILGGGLMLLMSMPRGEPEWLLVLGIVTAVVGIALTLPTSRD